MVSTPLLIQHAVFYYQTNLYRFRSNDSHSEINSYNFKVNITNKTNKIKIIANVIVDIPFSFSSCLFDCFIIPTHWDLNNSYKLLLLHPE
jgi:hypothetical protein